MEYTVVKCPNRYYGNFSFTEIAESNNIKLNTVLSHHRRALEKLRPKVTRCLGLGKENNDAFYLIIRTPWAKRNDIFAIAVDGLDINAIFYSPVGTPIKDIANMPLAKYVRECWESTDSEPFRFMDWTKVILIHD